MLPSSLKKIVLLAACVLTLLPISAFAQQNTQAPRAIIIDETTMQPVVQVNTNSQAGGALAGGNTTGGASISASGAQQSMGTCIGSSGIANFVKDKISGLINSITGSTEVPTADNSIRNKETGTMGSGYISWDQYGYCMINSLIEAIGKATVNWINGGFKGNPVFVDNPQQFFADIADIEAGAFLNEISSGFLCQPIKNIIKINLATNYNNGLSSLNKKQCTFTGVSGNLEKFMSGESFDWSDWLSYTQVPQNNPFGATIYGNIELNERIAKSLGVQSNLLQWGRGFLSFKDPETGKLSSPGSVIESQVNQRLFNGETRINMADEFDEVVNALVNQLVKVAINEVTSKN